MLKKESFTNYGDIKALEKTQSITSMCWQKNDKKSPSVSSNFTIDYNVKNNESFGKNEFKMVLNRV